VLIGVGLLLIVAVTAATSFFVAQEFGYVAVDRGKLKREAADGDAAAARALKVTERLSFMLSGAQLGITVTALVVGYVAEPYLGQGLADLLGLAGVPAAVSMPIAIALALAVATVVQMVLGELAPKNYAIARPERLAKALARPTMVYLTVFGPIIKLFDMAAARLLRRFGIEPVEELTEGATPEDLEQIIADSRDEGHLDAEMSSLLDRGLGFRQRTAVEVMVPRVDVVTVGAHEPATRVVELLESGRSRFPVRAGDGLDEIVGVVGIADVLEVPPAKRGSVAVGKLGVPPLLVPATLKLPAVLDRLRGGHRQLACVVDEYGGFAGIITLEDIAEELVGPIRDEDDLPEPAPFPDADGAWVVPGRWRIDEVTHATGVALPEGDDYDTVSGLVMTRLGRVPRAGDTVGIDLPHEDPDVTNRVLMTVLSVRRRVPEQVRLRPETMEVSS
jgi:CBS domain containing-hemolysin-like protein